MKLELFGYIITIKKKALEDTELPTDLQEALKILQKYAYKPHTSPKKTEAAHRATQVRQERVKRKIENAVNLLRLEGKKITPYAVSKVAGVSYNTAKKYLHQNPN